jgi:hypothetical protein
MVWTLTWNSLASAVPAFEKRRLAGGSERMHQREREDRSQRTEPSKAEAQGDRPRHGARPTFLIHDRPPFSNLDPLHRDKTHPRDGAIALRIHASRGQRCDSLRRASRVYSNERNGRPVKAPAVGIRRGL